MPTVKLTDAAVQRFKAPPGGRVEYFDATLPGFGLRVAGPTPRSPLGRKSWVLLYRFAGEQKRLTFKKRYPDLGLAKARELAGAALAMLPVKDPATELEPVPPRAPDTVQQVAEEFIRRNLEGKGRAPSHIRETSRKFAQYIFPGWGDRDIKSIRRRDVIEILDNIMDGSASANPGSRKRGGPVAANRVLAALNSLFNWAVRRDIIEANPAALVDRPGAETSRARVLSADELRSIWSAAQGISYPFGAFFQITMLVGQRRQEVGQLQWGDLDLQERIWVLPASATKPGRSHVVPLAPMVVEVLSALPRIGPHVFTASGKAPISGYGKAKQRLDEAIAAARAEAGVGDIAHWTIHDLRRTCATEMARLGVTRFVIERVLNHADRGVTSIYDRHAYGSEKRHALEAWASYIGNLVQPPAGNVVTLRAADNA